MKHEVAKILARFLTDGDAIEEIASEIDALYKPKREPRTPFMGCVPMDPKPYDIPKV